jgi:predicted nuclease of predicted toxin-antitoxin system
MKFKIDENLPLELAEILNAEGHDASTIYWQNMGGEPDSNVALV